MSNPDDTHAAVMVIARRYAEETASMLEGAAQSSLDRAREIRAVLGISDPAVSILDGSKAIASKLAALVKQTEAVCTREAEVMAALDCRYPENLPVLARQAMRGHLELQRIQASDGEQHDLRMRVDYLRAELDAAKALIGAGAAETYAEALARRDAENQKLGAETVKARVDQMIREKLDNVATRTGQLLAERDDLAAEVRELRQQLRFAGLVPEAIRMLAAASEAPGAAKNYVAFTFAWDEGGLKALPFKRAQLVLFRDGGKTPTDLVAELTEERDALVRDRDDATRQIKVTTAERDEAFRQLDIIAGLDTEGNARAIWGPLGTTLRLNGAAATVRACLNGLDHGEPVPTDSRLATVMAERDEAFRQLDFVCSRMVLDGEEIGKVNAEDSPEGARVRFRGAAAVRNKIAAKACAGGPVDENTP